MSNNIFSWKRFQLLFKQHFVHNSQLLWLSAVAYVGVIFIVLSLFQVGNGLQPHGLENFQGFLVAFFSVFSILYVGHSFPAFRSKESTISYLMVPASTLEKFSFELVSRIGMIIVILPLLFWITFNLHGYFFAVFTQEIFHPIGLRHLLEIEDIPEGYQLLIYSLTIGAVLFVLSVAFTGAAMFDKQPLVKSLFAVAVVVMFFVGYSYVVVEHLGVGRYNPPDRLMLIPLEEDTVLTALTVVLGLSTAVMLLVAYLKLKEREV